MAPRWPALAVLTAARISLGVQFQSFASVALPLGRDFAMSYVDLGFLIGLYMRPGIVLAIPGGALGQRFGDKRVVCAGLGLMVLGGAIAGLAGSYAVLVAGRLISGIGGILLNVVMNKMVVDWFAGREIVLAMATLTNAFPVGVGLSLLILGPLGDALGWRTPLDVAAATALVAFGLVVTLYRRHENDGRSASVAALRARIAWREIALVSVAGAIWGILNGAYSIIVGFASIELVHGGMAIGTAGALVGGATWLIVGSIVVGGIAAQRWGHPNALMAGSMTACGLCLIALPSVDPVLPLLAVGLLFGIPVGIVTALPAEVLRPETRGAGIGLFYTCLYVGHAGLPPVSGWLQDLAGSPATSMYFAGALILATVPLFGLFRLMQRAA